MTDGGTVLISVVVPVHNEEALLAELVQGITSGLAADYPDHELILCENGSADQTLTLAQALAAQDSRIVVLTSPQASYGAAIQGGILHSRGDRVVVFNADLWDLDFLRQSVALLDTYDMVVASKRHRDSHDRRPFNRRLITWSFNLALRLLFGFTGTDTHGMKAFRRARIAPIAARCITNREIFDTELILRGQRAGLTTVEVPVTVEETRPSRYSPMSRLPRTLNDLWRLYVDLTFGPSLALDQTP
jgi:glycosyltransferase involved in cell wall biosynthesis